MRVRTDIVAVLEGECDIGYSKNSDGSFDLIADLWGVAKKHNHTVLVNSINQKYAVNKTIKEAKQRKGKEGKKGNASISMSSSEPISSFNIKNKCPRCGSKQTIKYGYFQGKQKYKCQNCGTEFS
jgi:DNA-directed RNA polymerase subunit RPC12/RpoP